MALSAREGCNSQFEKPRVLTQKRRVKVSRNIKKEKAKKLFVQLVTADDEGTNSSAQEHIAAKGLAQIVQKSSEDARIVSQRFIKAQSRLDKGIRALLTLSDDELDESGYDAVYPVSELTPSMIILDAIVGHAKEALLLETAKTAVMREGTGGVAAIFYLGLTEMRSFFFNIDDTLILRFCKRVVDEPHMLTPRWYCGLKLLGVLFPNFHPCGWRSAHFLPLLLSMLFQDVVQQGRKATNPDESLPKWSIPYEYPAMSSLPRLILGCYYARCKAPGPLRIIR
ncbi:hypothetical protein FRB90_007921 [Tulasnella sp. 427]|nr:hypothetical protein FRB90_007921 [Tulasnella sp. 427]